MQVTLKADGRSASGGSPLVLHNERLADPLDCFPRAISTISKKRNKVEADHEEIGRLEFYGGLYTNPPLELITGTYEALPRLWADMARRRYEPKGATRMMACATTGGRATPGCGCSYCHAVFDEWGHAAAGFQRWYDGLRPELALAYFGEVRTTALDKKRGSA